MNASTKSTPRDVFLHLLAIAMLYVGIGAFLTLAFQYVNAAFPDELDFLYRRRGGDAIRGAIAALIVVWPVYLWVMRLLERDIAANIDKQALRVRKWLFNLTFFIAAVAVIIDLIALINSFLSGELTVRFGLKVLTVLLVAGVVLGYYRWQLRRNENFSQKIQSIAFWGSLVLVAAMIVAGFFVMGSPAEQRARRFDMERVNNLSYIQNEIISFWQRKDELPKMLGELEDEVLNVKVPTDPKTKSPYEYNALEDLKFELCATFAYESDGRAAKERFSTLGDSWEHGVGRTCFVRTIDPERHAEDNGPLPVRPY